ncbi:tRNA (N6-threonylcarbamoyladenosine(37)-N6)-methyltransferase TrmO [Parendozoicomonas haliclonae]|uniref:Putative tRNA (Adenine(37)-N6)-methyltransferase n=1 Tax=Parendozoicomonas haliclonae TaxID=1960125 RepID=A0A1X7AHN9_9GAMM|nr:tRNA (N6-threonylcarbamoyladenosine(37)-N6)-methyltransferase TrmO [Parendozoicomonas haliclonae]SMA41861.1 putative tRNA (adenine(37)-N6)-methyltransferase [Parendozoicomonas haliclonae]
MTTTPLPASVTLEPVGFIRSCYQEKFGIPRQPGLATSARAELHLHGPCNCPEAVVGLDKFSHIWIQFVFHQTQSEGWRPTVRPPRLGGEKRLGVFATRSTHRPNPLGLSLVKLEGIQHRKGQVILELSGIDLLDGTPVVDIKPYLPWADSQPEATAGFAPDVPVTVPVLWTEDARQISESISAKIGQPFQQLVEEVLGQDPRPAYLKKRDREDFGVLLWDYNVRWKVRPEGFEVFAIEPAQAGK